MLSGRAQPQKYDIIVLMDEYLDILDENGIKTGKTKLRRAVHRDGDWHRSVNILLITPPATKFCYNGARPIRILGQINGIYHVADM